MEAASPPWAELEEHLEDARRSILAEIRNYPPPIAACDQQFNYLLEQRDTIGRELTRLAALRRESSIGQTDIPALLDLVNKSDWIAPEVKADLLQRLHQRFGDPT